MGPVERGVRSDLKVLPEALRLGGIARLVVLMAQQLDQGGLSPRDAAGYAREIRLALMQLREIAPGDSKGDRTDEVKARREKRLAASGDGSA